MLEYVLYFGYWAKSCITNWYQKIVKKIKNFVSKDRLIWFFVGFRNNMVIKIIIVSILKLISNHLKVISKPIELLVG